ncbi:MAG: hypothetical protein NUW23_02565 [Firmicutes bacterium]|jgi:hypothetical protein|nr:hypothetical protein [Bacillota bacterium]
MLFREYQARELPEKYRAWLSDYGVMEDTPLDRVYELVVKVRLRRLASGAPGVRCKTQGLRRQTDIEVLGDLIDLLRPIYGGAKSHQIEDERDEIAARHAALKRIRSSFGKPPAKRMGRQPGKSRKSPLPAG